MWCQGAQNQKKKASVDFLTSPVRYGSFTRSSFPSHEERFAHINESLMLEHKGQIAIFSGLTPCTHTNTTLLKNGYLSVTSLLFALDMPFPKNSHHCQKEVR